MKFHWESTDIRAGRKYSRPTIKEIWMVGYLSNVHDDRRYVSISMSDGMVTVPYSAEELATTLTDGRYVPIEFLNQEKT